MNVIFYLIYNAILIFTIYKIINTIFDRNLIYNRNIEIISYLVYYICSSFTYLTIGIPKIMLFTNVLFIFLIQFNYKTNIKDKMLLSSSIYFIMFIIDIFNSFILNTINKNFNEMYFGFKYIKLYSIILSIILLIVLINILKLFKNMKLRLYIPNRFFLILLIVPFISIYLIIMLLNILIPYKNELFTTVFIIFVLNVAVFLTYKYIIEIMIEKEEKNILERTYINYIEQFELIKENFESLNILKHDFKKYISYVNKLILDENYDEVLKFIKEINSVDKFKNNKNIIKTNNTYIDTILNLKLNEAIENNINIETDINVPYDINMPSVDIICLLGNLLDNCIEANLKLNEKERYIFLKMKYHNKTLLISLVNKYDNIILDNNGYILTSKTNRNEKYGLGLKIVDKVTKKYDGVLEIKTDNNKFELNIIINLN